jgi:beta-N-acetylhexosaminidase
MKDKVWSWFVEHFFKVVLVLFFSLLISSVVAIAWKSGGFVRNEPAPIPEKKVVKKAVKKAPKKRGPIEVLPESSWVDSTLQVMTLDEKIGQFFMVATFSNRDEAHYRYIDKLIREYRIGGLLFFQGGPYRQAMLTNRYQAQSRVPLFIGIDGEWGLAMRLDSTVEFPRQMMLGSIRDNQLVYRMGSEIGEQCRRLGIHINFAPVSDINSNPNNPVIGNRSFGEGRNNVAEKSIAYMKGLQHNRVIATAKHFPGHGDTDEDSHFTLPVVNHSGEKIRELDLYPYQQLIADSLMGVLSGHLYVPGLDSGRVQASSLSGKVVTTLLRDEMGFRGLVFTDAMNMRGVLKGGKASDINVKALLAGNDVLLYPESIAETIAAVKENLSKGTISEEFINQKVKKILKAKYWAGLNQYAPVVATNLYEDLNNEKSTELLKELNESAVTVLKNDLELIPIQSVGEGKLATVTIGAGIGTPFQKMISTYSPAQHYAFYASPGSEEEINEMLAKLEPYSQVVVAVHDIGSLVKRSNGISTGTTDFVTRLKQKGKQVILCLFGTPYSIRFFPETDALMCINQDSELAQQSMSQVLFGALPGLGMLPVSVAGYKPGEGIMTPSIGRISYGSPEQVGMNSRSLQKIDAVVAEAMRELAFPGCQVVVARKGMIVVDKAYGTLSYKRGERVGKESLYDLASITKVAATLQAVMALYDQKAIDLDHKAAFYLPELKNTNKQNFTIRDLLLHRSGLVSFYPKLWGRTMTGGGGLMGEYYSGRPDSTFTLQVAPKLFTKSTMPDSVWKWVIQSPMNNNKDKSGKYGYVYSDLGFLTLQKIVERLSGQPLDTFVRQRFYQPMGLSRLGFTPLVRFPADQIAPTEQDSRYRGQLLQGTVHDQMAAMLGGVSGHAGLFGNAGDLSALMQMLLWKGKYAGIQYIQPATADLFAKMADGSNHRGLGWDKVPVNGNSSYVSQSASVNSFGHTGFTGNVVWADPDKELVFVFLSNRVHPDADNNTINTLKTRRKIHDLLYESLLAM